MGLRPDGVDEQVWRNIQALLAQNETALARLNEHLQALIPTFLEEYAYDTAAESSSKVLTITPTRDTYFRCTGFLVVVPVGTVSASLQLGNDFVIPLQNTTVLMAPIQRILEAKDPRRLFYETGSDNGGPVFAWLFGDAVPKYGKL